MPVEMGSWATLSDVFDTCSSEYLSEFGITLADDWDGVTPDVGWSAAQLAAINAAQLILDAAHEWLHEKTCNKFPGVVTDAVWPHNAFCSGLGSASLDFGPLLGDVPIHSVQRILTFPGGVATVMDPDTYRVSDRHVLVRQTLVADERPDPWPTQDLALKPGSEGTWAIEWTIGWEPTEMARLAVAQLACSWLDEVLYGDACDTTQKGASSINSNGVTIQLRTIAESLSEGSTQCTFTDFFLDSHRCDRSNYSGMFDPADEIIEVSRPSFPRMTHPIVVP